MSPIDLYFQCFLLQKICYCSRSGKQLLVQNIKVISQKQKKLFSFIENNRKYCFSSYCFWKVYISLNILSFEHSVLLTGNITYSHLGCFTQQSPQAGVRSRTAFMESCTKQTDYSTNQKIMMRRTQGNNCSAHSISGKSGLFVQMILLTPRESGGQC